MAHVHNALHVCTDTYEKQCSMYLTTVSTNVRMYVRTYSTCVECTYIRTHRVLTIVGTGIRTMYRTTS